MERAYSPEQLTALLTQKKQAVKNLLNRKSQHPTNDLKRFNTDLESVKTLQEKIAVCENWLVWYA